MKPQHLIYTRGHMDWQRFLIHYPEWHGHASHYPLLCLQAVPLSTDDIHFLKSAHTLVFTSQHAARFLLAQYTPTTTQRCIAIGQRTQHILTEKIQNIPIDIAPPPYNSEALLSTWQPRGQRIAIIAAPHGRTLLKDTLSIHNNTQHITCYSRSCTTHDLALPYRKEADNIILLTSGHGLNCLMEITPQNMLKLLQCKTIVACISPRLARLVQQAGFKQVFSAEQADENALMRAIADGNRPFRNFGVHNGQ